jgi:hypothetical protein
MPENQARFLKWFPIFFTSLGALISIISAMIFYTAWITKNVAQMDTVNDSFRKQVEYTNLKSDLQKAYTDAQVVLLRTENLTLRTEAFARADQKTTELNGELKSLTSRIDTFLLLMNKGKHL